SESVNGTNAGRKSLAEDKGPDKEDARYLEKRDLKELADWLKSCPHYRTALDKKPRKSRILWYQILRTSLEWLEDCVSLLL
ncbi:unnamed protein product, partial [Brassica napus]